MTRDEYYAGCEDEMSLRGRFGLYSPTYHTPCLLITSVITLFANSSVKYSY